MREPVNSTYTRLGKRLAIMFGPTIVLLLLAEVAVRIYYFQRHGHDLQYLTMPFKFSVRTANAAPAPAPADPVQYHYSRDHSYVETDLATGRTIHFTVNEYGERGATWTPEKSPGEIRVLAVGGSSTYGINNPDSATWPARLQEILCDRGSRQLEVLNVGIPGARLEHLNDRLEERQLHYRPDVVIYYEAFNNAIAHRSRFYHTEVAIQRLHAHDWFGREISKRLYYRSMLYTYLLEKAQFALLTGDRMIVPEIDYFQAQLQRFIRVVRSHGAVPVLVLQATQFPPRQEVEQLDLHDREAVKAFILRATRANGQASESQVYDGEWSTPIRAYQTQVLVEVTRRTGLTEGVQVIDPRPAFARDEGDEPLFCDVIHLTDRGNRILANAIAEQLILPPVAAPASDAAAATITDL